MKGLNWWMSPQKDCNYQWWFGYRKVRMVKQGKQAQKDYLKKQKKLMDDYNDYVDRLAASTDVVNSLDSD